jgi:hypothetical protein
MKPHQKINKRKQKRAAIGRRKSKHLTTACSPPKFGAFGWRPALSGIKMLLSDYMLFKVDVNLVKRLIVELFEAT